MANHNSLKPIRRVKLKFNKLTPGRYQIHVEAAGFKPQDVEAITLVPGVNRTEITLEIDVIKADVDVSRRSGSKKYKSKRHRFLQCTNGRTDCSTT